MLCSFVIRIIVLLILLDGYSYATYNTYDSQEEDPEKRTLCPAVYIYCITFLTPEEF